MRRISSSDPAISHVLSRSFGSHSLTYFRRKKWRVEIPSIDVRIHQLEESSPPAPLPPVSPPPLPPIFPRYVPARTTRHNDRFGVEAAEPTAPMPTGTLFLSPHLVGNRLSGTLRYVFLRRSQPLRAPQRPSTRRDLNMVDVGRRGATLPAPPHKSVTQHVG